MAGDHETSVRAIVAENRHAIITTADGHRTLRAASTIPGPDVEIPRPAPSLT